MSERDSKKKSLGREQTSDALPPHTHTHPPLHTHSHTHTTTPFTAASVMPLNFSPPLISHLLLHTVCSLFHPLFSSPPFPPALSSQLLSPSARSLSLSLSLPLSSQSVSAFNLSFNLSLCTTSVLSTPPLCSLCM